MKILVTGYNGFIGSSLCEKLRDQGNIVFNLPRTLIKQDNIKKPLSTYIDKEPDESFNFQNVECIVHLAARVHVMKEVAGNPLAEFRKVNVEGSLNLAQQAMRAGVKRFIFISSIGVNGVTTAPGKAFSEKDKVNPHNAYAISKWEAEQGLMNIAAETGLEVVIIRPPLVYGHNAPGNFGSLVKAIKRGIPLPLKNINNQRSFIALDNLIDFIITCTTHPNAENQTFLVSDGEDISTTELIRGIANAAGVSPRLFPIPTWALQMGGNLLGKGDAVQRLCGNLQVDISKARDLLGWTPPISVEEGLKRAVGNVEK